MFHVSLYLELCLLLVWENINLDMAVETLLGNPGFLLVYPNPQCPVQCFFLLSISLSDVNVIALLKAALI